MHLNLKSLIGHLNDATRRALESAAGLCVTRTHYDIEIEHYLLKLLDSADNDFFHISRRFGVEGSRLSAELTKSLDRLKSGNARTPVFSPTLVRMVTDAWTIGSIDYGASQIRTGFTILALLSSDELSLLIQDVSQEFRKIQGEILRKEFLTVVAGSSEEEVSAPSSVATPQGQRSVSPRAPNLDEYTVDLTENARKGRIDPVLGRNSEIRRVIDILMRRRQNNPILTGEAGVGKTAVVEGFARRVAEGDVPPPLRNVSVRSLDLALLQAGAGIKGEFENRLKGLIEEVKSSPTPIILFIDEAHTMIGAGGAAGQSDAANILKPALARGELRTIAATTWSEYKKYFEKDAALARRFQVVKVEEPTEEQCMAMLRGMVSMLEEHHEVRILDEAVDASVRLSHHYLAGRQLPDKAVSVLDTACARLSLGQNATPAPIEDATRRLAELELQQRILQRESALGTDHSERLEEIAKEMAAAASSLAALRARWDRERALVSQIRSVRVQLERRDESPTSRKNNIGNGPGPQVEAEKLRAELRKLESELSALQEETPLIRVSVDAQTVSEVICGWTGIPVGKMLKNELATVLSLPTLLGKRVIGQAHALETISERIATSWARLGEPVKPVGVFLLVGPSGVGKTETALALSDILYGGEDHMITINMSEFQEKHTGSTLKGSPPGYVGYGEGGVLTEAVRRRPYSVVLLDEFEKAHPNVRRLFYQVFDKGVMQDGEGREIDFKNTIIIMTTNACAGKIVKLCADPETIPTPEGLVKALKSELNAKFGAALLGRVVIVPFFPLRDEVLRQIVVLKLEKIRRRIHESHKIDFSYDNELVNEVAQRCTEVESGARNVDNILSNTLLPDISRRLLGGLAEGGRVRTIHVSIGANGSFEYASGSVAALP